MDFNSGRVADKKAKLISVVIPVFNEESNIPVLFDELKSVLIDDTYHFEFLFVDDGSHDNSLAVLKRLAQADSRVFYIELSRNFGHQYALKAGLDAAKGMCVVTMDCDLQHPPEVIKSLISKWEQGFDVVYTKRKAHHNTPFLKRKTSQLFYAFLNSISDLKLDYGTADFRLIDRNVLTAFSYLNESELFIRGLIKWLGFRQTAIEYIPRDRFSGKSKYSYRKMVSLAFRAITAFSVRPLQMIGYLGVMLFLISLILVPYALISYIMGRAVTGWTSLMIAIIFFGSLQLLILGIIGIYISKIVIQTKQRPLYLIRDTNYLTGPEQNQKS